MEIERERERERALGDVMWNRQQKRHPDMHDTITESDQSQFST